MIEYKKVVVRKEKNKDVCEIDRSMLTHVLFDNSRNAVVDEDGFEIIQRRYAGEFADKALYLDDSHYDWIIGKDLFQ